MAKRKNIEWKEYEDLIYRIYKELEPLGKVTKNDSIQGTDSGIPREIDISLRTKVANHEILMIIEAKKTKRPVTQQVIDGFKSVIQDVRAAKGIIICNSGFTKAVKENAKKYGIDILSAHDASKIDWQTEIQIPVIKKNIKVKMTIQNHFKPIKATTINGIEIHIPMNAFQEFVNKWEADVIPKTPGKHYIPLDTSKIPVDKEKWTFKLGIQYEVEHRYHWKYFIPKEYRGLRDYISKKFTPSFMSFSESIPLLDDGTWTYIKDPSTLAIDSLSLNMEIIDIDFLKEKKIRFLWTHNPGTTW